MRRKLEENKLGRLDILAILNDNTTVNVEVQVLNPYDFIDRSLYYWSGNYYNNLKAGQDYTEVKKTIAINILNYEQFEEGPFHETARIKRDYQNKILTDKMELHFIQIPKFVKEKGKIKPKLKQWMQFISQANQKEVELAMEENQEIKKANDEYEYLTGEEAERRLAFLRDKAIKDENNIRKRAGQEGEAKGMAKGMAEEKKQIAKKMLTMKLGIEQIEEATGLTKQEIEDLKE